MNIDELEKEMQSPINIKIRILKHGKDFVKIKVYFVSRFKKIGRPKEFIPGVMFNLSDFDINFNITHVECTYWEKGIYIIHFKDETINIQVKNVLISTDMILYLSLPINIETN